MEYEVCPATGKRKFESIGDAKAVLNRPDIPKYSNGKRVKRRMSKRKETRAYHCDDCGCFHLTSKAHYKKSKKK